jgi:ABC-type transporter Mla subunit MlaD
MRRLAKLGLALIVASIAALLIGTVAQGSDSYQFDVIFDDGRGLVSGQEVKIAGAVAGSISNVVVTSRDQARVEATIKGPFQFHTNASCTIRPDGLIAENYLDCDPGSDSKPLLKATGGEAPTVPVSQTTEPVSLQDLFNIFNLPTRERFQVLVDELGIATAGNGEQINSILRRANPTLQAAQRLISVLDTQTSQISTAISATDQIAREGANHTGAVRAFINQASGLTQLTSDHRSSLEQAINKLPAFLSASTPALKQLDTVATTGTPLLQELRAAAPSLNQVSTDIGPFAKLATPALAHLSTAISTVDPEATDITPVLSTLTNFLQASKGSTANFSKLIVNLDEHGFSENFLSVLYYTATALGKKDNSSHMLSSLLFFPGKGECATYATTPDASCNARYDQPSLTPDRATVAKHTPAKTRKSPAKVPASSGAGSSEPKATATTPPAPTQTTSPSAAQTSSTTPATTTSPGSSAPSLSSGLSSLLNGVGSTVTGATSGVTSGVNGVTSGANGVTSGVNGVTSGVNGVTSGVNGVTSGVNGVTSGAAGSSSSTTPAATTTSTQGTTTGSLQSLLNYLLN